MLNHIPRMAEATEPAYSLTAKFGGTPWGFPSEKWPICRECGLAMSSLAQIPVRNNLDRAELFAERLDLADLVLHVFTCERPSICSFWDADLGANAAFFLHESELSASAPPFQIDAPLLPEVHIDGWRAHEDAVTPDMAPGFTDSATFYQLPDDIQFPHDFEFTLATKLGGVPYWTGNGPQGVPPRPFRYLMQIDKFLDVPAAEHGHVDLANFCSDGIGFLFVDASGSTPSAKLVINR